MVKLELIGKKYTNMALKAPISSGNKNFTEQPNLEPGGYPARVVQVIAMGRMSLGSFDGVPKAPGLALRLTYELVDAFMVDEDGNDIEDKPRWVSEEFILHPASSDLATSTKRYNAIDPKNEFGGDWAQLLGQPCMVTIINKASKNGKVYDNVGNVAVIRPRDAANAAELKNPTTLFIVDEPDMEVFNKLPKFIRDKIISNLDYEGSALQKAVKAQGGPDAGKAAPDKGKEEKPSKAQKEAPEEQSEDEDLPW